MLNVEKLTFFEVFLDIFLSQKVSVFAIIIKKYFLAIFPATEIEEVECLIMRVKFDQNKNNKGFVTLSSTIHENNFIVNLCLTLVLVQFAV